MTIMTRMHHGRIGYSHGTGSPLRGLDYSCRVPAVSMAADGYPDPQLPHPAGSLRALIGSLRTRLPRVLFRASALWMVALLFTGCMITSQSLTENGPDSSSGQRLIKPLIPDSAEDVALASGSASQLPFPRESTASSSALPPPGGSVPAQPGSPPLAGLLPSPGRQPNAVPPKAIPPSPGNSVQALAQSRQTGEPANWPEVRPGGQAQPKSSRSVEGVSDSKTVKAPVAPARSGAKAEPAPERVASSEKKPPTSAVHQISGKEAAGKSDDTGWDDQKVRRAAMELRDAHPSAQKMKLCYAVKDDEWWAIFYEDAGTHYDLKQYVWDRERRHLDPFLVLRRIPRDRLQQDLGGNEPDRACEVVDLAPPSKKEGADLKANF